MIIHVMLKHDPSPSDVERIIQAARMREVNERRLERYGILTGSVGNELDLGGLKRTFPDLIESIECDESRRVLPGP